jgi:hypothetical protein
MSSVEYEKTYHEIIDNDDDLYSNLMKKEEKTLDMINRVVNLKEKQLADKSVLEIGIKQIVINTFLTLKNIANDLSKGEQLNLRTENRQIYLGILITFVMFCLILLYKIEE